MTVWRYRNSIIIIIIIIEHPDVGLSGGSLWAIDGWTQKAGLAAAISAVNSLTICADIRTEIQQYQYRASPHKRAITYKKLS